MSEKQTSHLQDKIIITSKLYTEEMALDKENPCLMSSTEP